MKIIGIIGSRSRDDSDTEGLITKKFFEIYKEGDWICSGGCPKGGDRFAEKIAKDNGIPILIFYPNWNKYGKPAGFIRNGEIASRSHVLIAAVAPNRTGGTEDTIEKFMKNVELSHDLVHLV